MNHRLQELSEFLPEVPKLCGLHIMFTSAVTYMGMSLTEWLTAADSARVAVLLHVSASSEGQE